MRIIAVGQHAEGVIAIGQEATGILAIGQFATGFVAIGQVARGVFALGQLALGVFAVGQLGLGLTFCLAMVGAGGRAKGIVLPLVPVPPRRKKMPPLADLAAVRSAGSGWVRARLERGGGTTIVAVSGNEKVPLVVTPELFLAAYAKARTGTDELFLELSSGDRRTYRLRTMRNATEDRSGASWLGPLSFVQLGLLCVAAWGYMQFFVVDFMDFVVRMGQDAALNGVSFF